MLSTDLPSTGRHHIWDQLRSTIGGPGCRACLARSGCGHHLHAWKVQQRSQRGLSAGPVVCNVVKESLVDQDLDYVEADYSPHINGEYWSRRPVIVVSRTLQIGYEFSRWFLRSRPWGRSTPYTIAGQQAEQLREVLTRLGPAFVKIGQAVSSRPDVVPPGLLAELEKLQDQIPPFPDAEAFQAIESELGFPISTVFSEITPTTIAAASLGQVYRGRLRSDGKEVAVKVQRPGVRQQIALDIFILRYLAGVIKDLRKFNSDLPALLDEWATSLFRELDYNREARNGNRFLELYSKLEGVYVPRSYEELSTQRVLIIEWVRGQRLRTGTSGTGYGFAGSQNDLGLVEIGVRCSLEQMLEEGYYHSDPHPGNLLRTEDNKLAYIDFGMMGQIDAPIRRGLIRATLHLVNREYDSLTDDFMSLGLLPPGSDKEAVVPALTGVFQAAMAGGVSNISFGELSGNLGRTMYQFQFRIPPYYTLLLRSLSVLEGIAIASDPNYKVLGAAYPWVARRLLTDRSEELRETLSSLLYKQGRFQFSRLGSLLEQAARSPGQSSLSLPPTPSGQPRPGGALEMLLSEEVGFVRGILLEELAKGLDGAWRLAADAALDSARTSLLDLLGLKGKEVEVLEGQHRATAGGPLLEALLALPALADAEDVYQTQGIMQLAETMERIAEARAVRVPLSRAASSFDNAAAILRWLATESLSLSPAARAEALWLPIQLGSKLSSRLAARTIRTLLGNAGPRPVASPVQIAATTAPAPAATVASTATPVPSPSAASPSLVRTSYGNSISQPQPTVVRQSITAAPAVPPPVPSQLQRQTASRVSAAASELPTTAEVVKPNLQPQQTPSVVSQRGANVDVQQNGKMLANGAGEARQQKDASKDLVEKQSERAAKVQKDVVMINLSPTASGTSLTTTKRAKV